MSARWTILIAIAAVAVGIIVGRAWGDLVLDRGRSAALSRFRRDVRRDAEALERSSQRADSVTAKMLSRPPIEIKRAQAGAHCALSYVVVDSSELQLFRIQAHHARRLDGELAVVGQGFAYREGGYRPGDSVTVVVPYTNCAVTIVMSYGYERIFPPPPLRLAPR